MIASGDDANLSYRFFAPPEGSRKIRFDQLWTSTQVQQNPFPCFESVIEQQGAISWSLESFDIRKELPL